MNRPIAQQFLALTTSGTEPHETQTAVWTAARVAFVGSIGAVIGGVVMPQVAAEYFDWMGGAVVGGLLFGAITAWF